MAEPENLKYLQDTSNKDSIPPLPSKEPNTAVSNLRKPDRRKLRRNAFIELPSGQVYPNPEVKYGLRKEDNPYDEVPPFTEFGSPFHPNWSNSTPDLSGSSSYAQPQRQGGPLPPSRNSRPPLSKSAYYQVPTVLGPSYPPPPLSSSYLRDAQSPAGAGDYFAPRVVSRPLASRFQPMSSDISNPAMDALDLERGKHRAAARGPVFESHGYLGSNYGVPQDAPETSFYRPQHSTAINRDDNYASINGSNRYEPTSATRPEPGTYNANRQATSVISTSSITKNSEKSRRKRRDTSSVKAQYGSDDDRDEGLHKRKTRTRGDHMAADDDDNVTIKVTGKTRIMVGGAQIDCESGGEINISRAKGFRVGSEQRILEDGVKRRERPSIQSTRQSTINMQGETNNNKIDPAGDHESVKQQVTSLEAEGVIRDAFDYDFDDVHLEMLARIDRPSPHGNHGGYVDSLDNSIFYGDKANTSNEAQTIAVLREHERKDFQVTARTPEETFAKTKVDASSSRNASSAASKTPIPREGPEALTLDAVPGVLQTHDIEAVSLAISKDGSADVEEAFTVSENDDTHDEIPTSDNIVRPWQYEDAESEEERSKVAFPILAMDADSSDSSTSDEDEEEEGKRQAWTQAVRAAKAKKRTSRSNASGYKRTLSVEIGSDTDEEDVTPMEFEAIEAGSSARRLRRKIMNDRSSLIFDDPPPELFELELGEEVVEDKSAGSVIHPILGPRKYLWEAVEQEEPAILQTSTFRNSVHNQAHFSNPNFSLEEWKPDPDEEVPERYKGKGAMKEHANFNIKNNEEVSGLKNMLEDDVDRSDMNENVTSPIIAFGRPASLADASMLSPPTIPRPHHFLAESLATTKGEIVPEFRDISADEAEGDQTVSQHSRDTIAEGIFYQDDDNRSQRSEVSDAPSLASVADSIFSYISGSSMSSVAGPVGAGERFVALLLEDDVIYLLCTEGLQSISPERFERNFRRMLKEFAVHLRQEAATIQQRNAAHFVRFRARNSAHIVCNRLGDWKDAKKILPEISEAETNVGNDDIEVDSDESSSNESEDGLNDLQLLEMFIKNSRAITLLKGKLRDFVYPPVVEQQTIRHVDKKVQEMEQEMLVVNGELETALTVEPRSVNCTKTHPNSRWQIPSFLTSFMIATRLRLPPVEAGKTRIEWKCKCGHKIVDDFIENRPGGLFQHQEALNSMKEGGPEIQHQVFHSARKRDLLKKGPVGVIGLVVFYIIFAQWRFNRWRISRLAPRNQSQSATCQFLREGYTDQVETQQEIEQQDSINTGSTFTTSGSKSSIMSQSFQSFRNLFTFNSKASIAQSHGLPLHSIPTNPALASTPPPPTPIIPQDLLFLLLCYSEGRYATRLMQLDLVTLNATSDKALFKILRANYRAMRPRFSSFFSLRSLEWIKFVHFEMYRSELVDVRKVNDIPPPGHVEYKYAPAPPDVIPPVGDRHMMHLFRNPECADDDMLCLSRFPKKLREKLKCQTGINPGWGLQFVEGWDFRKLWVLVYVLFGLGSLILGVLWAVYKHSVQDAFAIAAYMLTFAVLTVGLVQALLIM